MAPVSHQGNIIEGVAVSSLEDAMIEITPDVWLLRKSRGPAVEEGDDFENQRKLPDDILVILRRLGDFADGFYGKSIANALVPTRHKLVVGRSSMVLQRYVPALLKEPASVLPFQFCGEQMRKQLTVRLRQVARWPQPTWFEGARANQCQDTRFRGRQQVLGIRHGNLERRL